MNTKTPSSSHSQPLQSSVRCNIGGSSNNVLLIAAQHAQAFADAAVDTPEPGYVAGFATWRALGRSVDKGQHGYMVLAPCRYDRKVAVGPAGQTRPLDTGETPVAGERLESRKMLAGFRVEHVFSVAQTSGTELPEPPGPQLLAGVAPAGLGAAVLALIEDRGYGVDTVADAAAIGGANGVTHWDARRVLIGSDMDDAAMVRTLLHEAAHVLLHAGPPGQFLPRPLKEVEAESVAFVVAATHGMVADGYSFPYVAAWAGHDAPRAVAATQARVAQAARTIIAASPAPHSDGGRPPGATDVAMAAEGRRAELESRFSPPEAAAPTVGL